MNISGRWEEIEHMADIGLYAWGESREELFYQVATGMINLLVNPESVESVDKKRVEGMGEDYETMLVNWLDEILFAFDSDQFTPKGISMEGIEGDRVTGLLLGESFQAERHVVLNNIKAVTWHGLDIKREDGVFHVTVIFDV